MNFACGDARGDAELAPVKALASKAGAAQPDLIHWNQARFAAVCGWRAGESTPELQAKIQQQAPVIDAPLTEALPQANLRLLRRGAKLSFIAGACC